MYIVYYDKDMVQLDLFFKLASSRLTLEMIQDLKLGKSILIDNVTIQLQLREKVGIFFFKKSVFFFLSKNPSKNLQDVPIQSCFRW